MSNNNSKNKKMNVKRKYKSKNNKPDNNNNKKFKKANLNDLNWKTVEITKDDTAALNMSDLQGFYGVEELENVRLVKDEKTGKVEFLVKDDGKEEEEKESKETVTDLNDEFTGFKNMDDFEEGELSALESDELEKEDDEAASAVESDGDENELKSNVFKSSVDYEKLLEQSLEDDIDFSIALPEWKNLNCFIDTHILNKINNKNFKSPTEIQKIVLPHIINENANVIGKANTGSGKTLAYSIPILNKLFEQMSTGEINKNEYPIGLIFTPTRELATQVTKVLKSFIPKGANEHMVLTITGGLAIQKQERLLLNYEKSGNGKIIITTPGRFLEILGKNKQLVEKFSNIQYLVLDEADRLLQDGHFDEFIKIYQLLYNKNKELLKQNKNLKFWQTLIFSATFQLDLFNKLEHGSNRNKMNDDVDEKEQIIQNLMSKIHFNSKPLFIDCNPTNHLLPSLKELKIECLPMERNLYLYYILTVFPENSIIFTNSIESCKKLNVLLKHLNIDNHIIHSKMLQKKRLQNLENFTGKVNKKNGKPTVLIASDVAARGLDIPNIKHVIHYHLPKTADTYIHRSGRTLRGNTQDQGFSLMLLSPQESMGPLRKLRKTLSGNTPKNGGSNKKIKWQNTIDNVIVQDDLISQLKERVKLANEITEHEVSNKSIKKDDTWLAQAAKDLGLDESDSDDDGVNAKNLMSLIAGKKDHFLERNQSKKFNKIKDNQEIGKLKYELKQMLQQPIRYNMRQKYLTSGLVNYADQIVKNKGHESILGLQKMNLTEAGKKNKKFNKNNRK
ncbi:hypothetical protein ACO0SA_003401 [Hanseniaspora valbyensis]